MLRNLYLLSAITFIIGILPLELGADPAFPADPLILESQNVEYFSGLKLDYLVDPGGALSFQEIQQGRGGLKWTRSLKSKPSFGFKNDVYWFRFAVANPEPVPQIWFFQLAYPHLDFFDLYYVQDGRIVSKKFGDHYNFAARDISHRNFTFPLKLPSGKTLFYGRVDTASSINLPISFTSADSFVDETYINQLGLGFYYGAMVVMIVYNVFLFLSIRDLSYLYYVLYISGYVLFQVTLNGISFQYFWSNSIWWANTSLPLFMCFGAFWGLVFTRAFLQTRSNMPRYDWVFKTMMVFTCTGVFLSLILPYKIIILYATGSILVSVLSMLVGGVHSVMTGYRPARYFMLAWTMLLVGIAVFALKTFGRLPTNLFTTWSLQIGSAIEVVLLSLGLGDKINQIKKEKAAAQEEALRNRELALESLKRADKLKDEFLANTSHELRTPLNGIIGIADSILDGVAGPVNDNMDRNLNLIVSSGKRLSSLINDILDFSKLQNREISISRGAVGLSPLAESVVALCGPMVAGKELEIRNDIPADLPAAFGDDNRLQQIFFNLIGNGVKFTEAGSVTLSARVLDMDSSSPLLLKLQEEIQSYDSNTELRPDLNQFLEISVSDTGIGIPEDKLQSIFLSFEQGDASTEREYGGTGLGLSITRRLVNLHGGELSVESTPGEGSRFFFTMPLTRALAAVGSENDSKLTTVSFVPDDAPAMADFDPASENESGILPELTAGNEQFRILVVDDEPINRQVLFNLLNLRNFQVTEVGDGESAIECLNQNSYDLVLLDVMMPRMNGYDVCRKIRERFTLSDLPVIMLTAKNQIDNMLEGINSGANDYLPKPFSKHELLARMKTHLQLYRLNSSYGRFVPREFLEFLDKESILDVNLGDQVQKEMTILFSDIRSFTTLLEKMSPQEAFSFINTYLGRIGPIISENNGFIDKFIGDAVMAIFPLSPEDALQAAVQMQQQVGRMNHERVKANLPPIRIGVGLHTGSMMLGTIGDAERMQGTVISDAVNLASRMENLTKIYGSHVLVSEQTLSRISDPSAYNHRNLDTVRVKGKQESVSVIEILLDDDPHAKLKLETRPLFESAIRLYLDRQFVEAAAAFQKVLDRNPRDKAADLYLKRSKHYEEHGTPTNWKGVEALK